MTLAPQMFSQALPHSPEMEQAILGSMMASPSKIDCGLQPEVFHLPQHVELYELLADRFQQDLPTDAISVAQAVYDCKPKYLTPQMVGVIFSTGAFGAANYWDDYIAGITTRWQAREIIKAAQELQGLAFTDPERIPEHVTALLPRLQISRHGKGILRHIKDILMDASDRWSALQCGEMKGVSTGFARLDELTGGFGVGELVVVCGETKSGKTALAVQMACTAAKNTHPAAVFSLEMSDGELIDRVVSSETGINAMAFRNGKFGQYDMPKIHSATKIASKWPLWITHEAGTLSAIQSECRRLKGKLRLVVVDYIQLVETTMRRGETREQQVSGISRALKALASECQMTVIGLSQLNEDGRLRESRALGQDANLVLAVDLGKQPTDRELRIVVQRSGPAGGKIPLTFRSEYVRFDT